MCEKIYGWLEQCFFENQVKEWEGSSSVEIETVDNPGWVVEVRIEGTKLENKDFNEFFIDNGKNDWIQCEIKKGYFKGAGDARKLTTILNTFKEWVES